MTATRVIAVASAKGAPGATTTALAMAAGAVDRMVLAELDPDGGVLAARRTLSFEPGLISLAAALLRGGHDAVAHTQALSDRVRALVAPSSAAQVRAAVTACGDALVPALRAVGGTVVVDCGRLAAGSVALPVAAAADVTTVVLRPTVEDVAVARDRIPMLREADVTPLVVLTDGGPYGDTEVSAAVDAPVIARLPWDGRTADALNGRVAHRRLARTRLVRAARSLLATLAAMEVEDGDAAVRSA